MKSNDKRVRIDSEGYFIFIRIKNRANLQKYRCYKNTCRGCNAVFFGSRNGVYCTKICYRKYRVFSRETDHGISTETARRLTGRDYVRELVRVRDGHKCQTCGKEKKIDGKRLDVHHLNGLCGKRTKKCDKVSDMDGLITLCHKCHFAHHQFSTKSQFKNRVLTSN